MTETGTELSISFISQHLPAAKVLQEGYLTCWGHVVYSQILADKIEQEIHHFFSTVYDIDDIYVILEMRRKTYFMPFHSCIGCDELVL